MANEAVGKRIKKNQITSVNTIIQNEHEDDLCAKRVVLTGLNGELVEAGQIKVEVGGVSVSVTGFTCPTSGVTSAAVTVQNDAFTKPWDDLEVTARRSDGQPAELTTRKGGVDQQVGTVEYFSDGEFRRITVVDS